MKSPLEAAACAVNVGILRAASLFVPARQRMEWRSEWRGELWQARSQTSSRFSWAQEREIAGFCLGAFSDAFCLRRIDRHIYAAQTPRTRSLPLRAFSVESAPSRCITNGNTVSLLMTIPSNSPNSNVIPLVRSSCSGELGLKRNRHFCFSASIRLWVDTPLPNVSSSRER